MGFLLQAERKRSDKAMLVRLNNSMILKAAIVLLIAAGLVFFVYVETRESYLNVGFNSGVSKVNRDLILKIREHGRVVACNALGDDYQKTSLARSKSEEIFFVNTDTGLMFCEER